MDARQREFCGKLADLLDEYDASIWADYAERSGIKVGADEISCDWDADELRCLAEHGMTQHEWRELVFPKPPMDERTASRNTAMSVVLGRYAVAAMQESVFAKLLLNTEAR
jgi:hypothetical protein